MPDRRQRLVAIFHDTRRFYKENAALAAAVAHGRANTRLYGPDDYPELSASDQKTGHVQIVGFRTFEAAIKLHKAFPHKKITVLNFGSATNPGGGVKYGSMAQEECLCRCSTLFPTLDSKRLWKQYYTGNRQAKDIRYSDACIYSPGVVICKKDTDFPIRMAAKDFVTVDVITCAAPNLRYEPSDWRNPETGNPVRMNPQELYELHVRRARHILHVAASNATDILVLGAFGCGAFRNDPDIVAEAYRAALQDYRERFDEVVFAVYCKGCETENFAAFEKRFGKE